MVPCFKLTRGAVMGGQGGGEREGASPAVSPSPVSPQPGLHVFCEFTDWVLSTSLARPLPPPQGRLEHCSNRASEQASSSSSMSSDQTPKSPGPCVVSPTNLLTEYINLTAFVLFLFPICQLAWKHIGSLTRTAVPAHTGQTSVRADDVGLILI